MSRSTFRTRLCVPVLCLLCGVAAAGAARAQEAECGSNPDVCDLQETRTFLRAQLWGGDCQPALLDRLPQAGFPIEVTPAGPRLRPGLRAPVNFLNGVCLFHRAPRAAGEDARMADLDEGISELQRAQTVGLLPAQRTLATLFEGLLHCRKLDALQAKHGDHLKDRLLSRELYCRHRGMAKASLGSMTWMNLELSYEEPSTFSLEGHVESMSQCFGRHLYRRGDDALCGIVSSPSEVQVQTIADAVADGALTSYFGDASGTPGGARALPPLKAMLARKIQMADASVKGSAALFQGLNAKNELLRGSYGGLAAAYCSPVATEATCSGPIPSAVAELHGAYESAALRAQDLVSFVDRWVNGLFEVGGRDVRLEVKKSSDALADALVRLEKPGAPGELTTLEKVELLGKNIAQLADVEASGRRAVLGLCGVYLCEIRGRAHALFQRTCDVFDPALGTTLRQRNPLCAGRVTETFLSEARDTSASTVCGGAGFPARFMTGAQMSRGDVEACTDQFHP